MIRNFALLSVKDSNSEWLFEEVERIKNPEISWHWIDESDLENIEDFFFEKIFVFRWPKIIRKSLLDKQEFIGFHTSNLPEGRGGSPIQNQIMDNIFFTKVNSIKLTEEIDKGPVYLSTQISLQGKIEDIWRTISRVSKDQIISIIEKKIDPIPQTEKNNDFYKRRKDNSILQVRSENLEKIYNFIQMLDGDGYPRAFLEFGNYIIEFERSSLKKDKIICDAIIREKK